MMRLLLSIIVAFFAVLLFCERSILFLFYSITKGSKKMGQVLHSALKTIQPRPKYKKRGRKKKPQNLPIKPKLIYLLIGCILSFCFLFLPLVFLIFVQDLPTPNQLTYRDIPQTTKIYDRNGTLLTEVYENQDRTIVPLAAIPQSLQQATIAIEDNHFYSHPGFDIAAIIRATQETLVKGNIQGGSTITQQLMKSALLTPERSIWRKIKEVFLAFWAERVYTKKQILEMYFNHVPYGGTAWGVQAAAELYFDKSVSELSLAESAFLAGLTAAPTYYSPYGLRPDAWKYRQKEVLHNMVKLDFISEEEARTAEAEKLSFQRQQFAYKAPHFVEYTKAFLSNKYGLTTVEKGGLHVITTIDLEKQQQAETFVAEEIERSKKLNLSNGAALVTDPKTGAILAMVGSYDFTDPQFGKVNSTTAKRQPGSSVKVITYALALENGLSATTLIDDTPVSFPSASGVYTPVNYDNRFHGRISLRNALANSYNIPAVRMLEHIGIPEMITLGKAMGITSWGNAENYGLSLTLGAGEVTMLEMAQVYGVLANEGIKQDVTPLLKVTDANGKVLEDNTQEALLQKKEKQILDPGIAFIISDILADNIARSPTFGITSPLHIPGYTVSVKTGTTDNKRDNWTIGYTSDYVVTVWVGNNDNSPMSPELTSGISGAAPIWNKIMKSLLSEAASNSAKPTPPENVIQKQCFGKTEYFIRGTETGAPCR